MELTAWILSFIVIISILFSLLIIFLIIYLRSKKSEYKFAFSGIGVLLLDSIIPTSLVLYTSWGSPPLIDASYFFWLPFVYFILMFLLVKSVFKLSLTEGMIIFWLGTLTLFLYSIWSLFTAPSVPIGKAGFNADEMFGPMVYAVQYIGLTLHLWRLK